MNKRKYLHIITHFAPDFHFGGVVESGTNLNRYLRELGNFAVITVSKNPEKVRDVISGYGKCYKSFIFHRYGFSLQAIWGLWEDVKKSDVIYANGIASFPNTLGQLYAFLQKKPFALATHGLTEWSMSYKKWRKLFYFMLLVFPLMRKAKFIRVTSTAEEVFLKKKNFFNTKFNTNGISAKQFKNLPDKYSYSNIDRGIFVFLFLGRIAKEKGLDILVGAYKEFCNKHRAERHMLIIAGPDHQGFLKKLRINFNADNFRYLPGVYEEDKIKLLRRADVVILPSYSENFGNAVAEALACERPVITTTGTPWNEIEQIGCGLYINPDKSQLINAMGKIYRKTPEELESMGKAGRSYILNKFDWKEKAKELFTYLEEIPLG